MKVIDFKNVIRKDVPIYYRRLYSGIVILELVKKQGEYRIDFSIEQKPTGLKDISITFLDAVDYPLIPLNKEIKSYIDTLDSNGGLPNT